AELAEGGRYESNTPRRGEGAANCDHAHEVPVDIEKRHRSVPRSGILLGCTSHRRISHIDIPADVLHVERDESGGNCAGGGCECAGEAHWLEQAVEDVDAPGPGGV